MKVITVNMMKWQLDVIQKIIDDGIKGLSGRTFASRSDFMREAIATFLEEEKLPEGEDKAKVITINLPGQYIDKLDAFERFYASRSEVIRTSFDQFMKKNFIGVDICLDSDPEEIKKYILDHLNLFSFEEIEKMLSKVRQKKIDIDFLACLDAKKKMQQESEYEMVSIPVQLSPEISSAVSQYKSYKIVPREKNEEPVPTNSYEENVIPLI